MSTKVGAGESKEQESFKAGVEAAQSAFSQAEMDKCDFVLMFATAGYNQEHCCPV